MSISDLKLVPLPRHQAMDFLSPTTPSVTRALKQWADAKPLAIWKMNRLISATKADPTADTQTIEQSMDDVRSRDIGSRIHKAVETLPPDITPYLGEISSEDVELRRLALSYTKFRISDFAQGLKPVQSEVPLAAKIQWGDDLLGVLTGTADMVAQRPDGSYIIIDWKTSKRPYIEHAYQVSAYSHMYGPTPDIPNPDRYAGMTPGPRPEAFIVYLSKTHARGKFRIFSAPSAMYHPVVMGALQFYGHTYLPDWVEVTA